MNYRHRFHAGNFGDVLKHVLLVALVRALQEKEKGFLYLDTHSGRGSYDLEEASQGDTRARRPEWPEGIGRLKAPNRPTPVPPAVEEYVELVRAQGHYPGSPAIAALLARPQDRLVFCEKQPAEAEALDIALGGRPGVSVQERDGYNSIAALLPPPERRALVLIDPPFESQDEAAQIAAALAAGLRRLPSGVFAVWYPLTSRVKLQGFFRQLLALSLPPTLVTELWIAGEDSELKVKGCALAVLNPPWKFDRTARQVAQYLGVALSQGSGSAGGVTWLIPEKNGC